MKMTQNKPVLEVTELLQQIFDLQNENTILKKRMELIESQMTYLQQLFPSQKPKEVLIFILSIAYLYIICIIM